MGHYLRIIGAIYLGLSINGCSGFRSNPSSGSDLPVVSLGDRTLMVATHESINLGSSGYLLNKVYLSQDFGKTWELLPREDNGFQTGPIRMLKTQDDRIIIGTHQGVAMTDDLGKTWSYIEKGIGQGQGVTYDFIERGDTLVLATGKGVNISTDGGSQWTNYRQPQWGGGSSPTSVGVDFLNNKLYVTTLFDILVTEDFGQSWQPLGISKAGFSQYQGNPTLTIRGEQMLVTDLSEGLHLSNDAGNSWSALSLPDVLAYREFVSGAAFGFGNRLYAWSYLGIFMSADLGKTWEFTGTASITGIEKSRIGRVAVNGPTILMHTYLPDGLFWSVDGGKTWQDLMAQGNLPKNEQITQVHLVGR